MSLIHNTVTPAKLAANRANDAESHGPSTDEGKDHAKMNALKHGRAAARPDPVALFLTDSTEPEEAERQALRQETLRRYQPADDFAASEATELADLRFELVRLGRVREVVWKRERELLELGERRRQRDLQYSALEATREAVRLRGLLSLPDSPAKWRETLDELGRLQGRVERRAFDEALESIRLLYGRKDPMWRGERLWKLAVDCQKRRAGAAFDEAYEWLQALIEEESRRGAGEPAACRAGARAA
jgi:hypothetical protein